MITDDERREVALRMRGIDAERLDRVYGMDGEGGECSDPDMAKAGRNLMLGAIAEAVGLHYAPYYFDAAPLRDRLADLIEPDDRNDELCVHCDYCDYCDLPKCSEQDGYSFKPKGYVDLLALTDKIIRTARPDMEICGDTVPAWYAAGRLEAVARRIREILGVES